MNTGTLSGMKSGVGGFRVGSPRSAVNTGTGRVRAAEGRFGCVPHNQQLGGGGGAMTSRPTNALAGHPGIAFFPGDFGAMVVAGNGGFLITNGNSPYSSFFHTGGQWFFDGGGGGGMGTFESNSWFQNVPDVDSGIGICGQFVSGNILKADHGTVTVSDWHDFWSTTGFVTDPTTTRPGVITMTNRANYFAEMGKYNVGMTLTTEAALRIVDNLGVSNGAVVTTRVGVDIPLLAQPTGGSTNWGVRSLTPSLLYGLSTRKAGNTSDLFAFGDLFGAPFMTNTDGAGGTLGSMAVSATFGYIFTHAVGIAIQDFGDTGPRVTLGHIGAAASAIFGDGAGGTFGVLTVGSGGFSFNAAVTLAGGLTVSTGQNITFGTGTGSQIGTGTTQKIGFWNATPVAQISGSTDVLAGLVTIGLRAASSNPPLNLGSGALTAGAITAGAATFSGNVVLQQSGDTGGRFTFGNVSTTALLSFGDGAGATFGTLTVSSTSFSFNTIPLAAAAGLIVGNGTNIALGVGTGTIIGVTSSQKLGFWGATPIVRGTAFTQTYSTATHTHAAITATNPPAGGTGATQGAYDTSVHRDAMITSLTANIADVANVKQVLNGLIDDLQAIGLIA